MASATEQRVIKMVQELLLDVADTTPVTPALISKTQGEIAKNLLTTISSMI